MDVRSPFFQHIAATLAGILFLNPIMVAAAEATLAAANGNTQVTQAANGVPVVNIAGPNGNGLSHNKFSDYNVGQQGLILNNATGKTQSTQLGGIILGNPNLQGQAAKLILNEVTGGSPSQLRGYTEVAGQQAHVVVANPNGITCNGCGFINTPRATLTTGKPVIEGGQLDRLQVDGGAISIEGQGLNASNVDQFDLITRSAQINAELQANKLNIITGTNDVKVADLAVSTRAADPADAPLLAIDSSALGGMYAGAIRLVGTEAGVGVKLAGDLAASAGDIQIDANGQLTLARTAASGELQLAAQDIDLTRGAFAGGNANVTASERITVQESLAATGDVTLDAQRIDNLGNLEAGVRVDGGGNAASTLHLAGGTLTNRGKILAQGDLSTELNELDNRSGQLVAADNASIEADAVDNRSGQLLAQQALQFEGTSLDNRGGTLASNAALTVNASATVRNGDDGLLLSKSGGLDVTAQVLDNQGGTLQADSGNLNATAERIDNQQGQVSAGNGALTLTAAVLNNQEGQLVAAGGALTIASATTDNHKGQVQADSLDITATQRLNNTEGSLVATQGEQNLVAEHIDNQGGRITAKSELQVSATSLDNSQGSLGANRIGVELDGALNNGSGLIESATTLALQAGSLNNDSGKLRALGSAAGSQSTFNLNGLLDNDDGLVEIGSGAFSLTSQELSNQGGTVRHVGDQGFHLALADMGQAGGSFITNGDMVLNAASWSNSSLLQARKLSLDIGTFTQTASGKLISVEDIDASGDSWNNDGSIETDGALNLTLSGAYQGSGSLQSLGDMSLTAASAEFAAGAQVRAGGAGEFQLGGSLLNLGQLSAAGDLHLQAASLSNLGTLGSAQALRIDATTLVNWGGLIFSGEDMLLRSNSLTNLQADIYSLGTLDFARDDEGAQAALLENRSGSIESASDMSLRAASLVNRKELFSTDKTLTYGHVSVKCYDCSGDHHNVDYVATERFDTTVTEDSAAARIHTGGDLAIQAGAVTNRYSNMSASGDIDIVASSLENTGAATGSVERVRRFNTGRITDGSDERFRDNYVNPYNSQALPKELPSNFYRWNLVSDIETVTATGSGAAAIIQAGGQVNIQASQSLSNSSVVAHLAPQAGSEQSLDSGVSSTAQPLVVQLNAQLPPDGQQQGVDPLALPGFSLPQGQNGLFRVNSDPSHPYLIETNPLFASLKQFLSSSYMLDALGYDNDQAWRRLGDGLYEQRLIEQAIVARTGKRFLDGLTSNEAQFKYLMDNAIASKESLNLAPGVALSAEQVAALTHDIVWMQEQEVNGQKVLVPVLYLAQAGDRLAPSGALIQGQDVALISGGDLHNSGTLRATSNLNVTAANIGNTGLLQANERLQLLATDSIRNAQGGIINAKDISAIALTGDIRNERTITQEQRSGKGYSQLTSVVDNAAAFEAGDSLSLAAGGDLLNIGGTLKAGGNADLSAGGDLIIASAEAENGTMRKDKRHYWNNTSTTQYGSDVQVGGDLSAQADGNLAVIASTVKAGGDVALASGGDTTIAAAANESSREYRYKRSDKKVNKEDSSVRQQAAVIEAGGDLDVVAGGNLVLSASQLKAGQEAYLYAGEQLALTASANSDYHLYDYKKKGSFGSKKTQRDEVTDVRNVGSSVTSGSDLTLVSEGDQLYQRARLDSGGDLTLDSGGAITFEAVKDLHQESHEKSDSDLAWTSAKGKGKTDETLLQTQMIAQGDVVIRAVDGLNIDVKQVNKQTVGQTIDAMVKADPSLAWIKEAEARGDVDWRQVKEIHDSFKYSHSGLGAGAQLVIAIVVAYFTAGAASGLAASGASAAGASTAASSAWAAGAGASLSGIGWANAAATAVMTGAASNATISTINNRGNLGAVLKDVTSEDALRGYVVSGATAGLTTGYFNEWTSTQTSTGNAVQDSVKVLSEGGLSSWSGIGSFAGNQLLQNGTSTVLDRALGGDSSFSDALRSSLANTFAAAGFNWIGDISAPGKLGLESGSLAKIGLHAVMGGLAAEAAGGDFKTGALAAGLNEALVDALAQQYGKMSLEEKKSLLVMNSQVIGVLAVAAQGGDEKDLQTGAWVAGNATQYNHLDHADAQSFDESMASCGGDEACQRANWQKEKYAEESIYNDSFVQGISGAPFAKDKMGQIAAGLDVLLAMSCSTSLCEGYKLDLIESALSNYSRLSEVLGEWSPALDRLGLISLGAGTVGAGGLRPRPAGTPTSVGAAQVERAVEYFASVRAVGAKGVDKLFEAGRTPKASELKQYAEAQGWKPSQTDGGPLKYVDGNGIPRVTIKQGSSRAPGSSDPHVEFKSATGQRIDAFGNPVTRKSLGNHTSIDFDL